MQKLSIIIPAYNEAKTISTILELVGRTELINQISKEIIVVDDCSTDNTLQEIERFKTLHPEINIITGSHIINQGKGAAIHTGIKMASGDYCIVQDADLEYDPEEYNSLIRPVFKAGADVVYGSRFMGDKPHRILFFWHSIGNAMLTMLTNMCTNLNLTDMETCYKLIRTDLLKAIIFKEKRFGFEPEVTCKLARNKDIKIYEVGISYYGRTYAEGKKINWQDGFRAIYCILLYGLLNG